MAEQLTLSIEIRKDIDGLEMGVLSDGTSFMSMRGLAKLCGVANSSISDLSRDWLAGKRDSKLAQFLVKNGCTRTSLYAETNLPGVAGNVTYAFQEDVCMLVLEYYAFEAASKPEQALRSYRTISRAGLRLFIYTAVGYDPRKLVPDPWKHFHDRVVMHAVPIGYFSVFKESADFVIASIQHGLKVDTSTVPDISIGQAWAAHWKKNKLAEQCGERQRHDHNYPDYFPQAVSNPQEIWIYPVESLGEFRRWMHEEYVPTKFANYLAGKMGTAILPASAAQLLAALQSPPQLKSP